MPYAQIFMKQRISSSNKSVLNNFVILLIGQLLSKPIWYIFFNFILIYKLSQIENNFFAAAYFQTLLYLDFADLGTGAFVNKYLAQKGNIRKHIIAPTFNIRIILAILLVFFYTVGLLVFASSYETTILFIVGISYHIVIRNIEFCRSIFKGLNLMLFDSISQILEKALVILLGTILLLKFELAYITLIGMLLGAILTLGILTIFIHLKVAPLRWNFKPKIASYILKNSFPLALLSTAIAFNKYMGINLLNYFHNEAAVGKLSFPLRYLEMLNIIPVLLVSAYFPYLVRFAFTKKVNEFKKGLTNALVILLIIGILTSFTLLILIPYLYKIFPTQEQSRGIFIFLALMIPIAFINNLLANIILGINKEKVLFYITVASFMLSIILNIFLIPSYDSWGVVISWAITDVINLIGIVWIIIKYVQEISEPVVLPAH